MLTKKTIITAIDVEDPIEVALDIEGHIRKVLTDEYLNKCFKGIMVKSIDEILKYDLIKINPFNQTGTIDVECNISGTRIEKDDIIFVRVQKRNESSWFLGEYLEDGKQVGIIGFDIPKMSESVTVGQIVPVVVVKPSYPPKSPRIKFNGYIYPGQTSYPVYLVQCNGIRKDTIEKLPKHYITIDDELKAIPAKEVKYFAEITKDKKTITSNKYITFYDFVRRTDDYTYVGQLLLTSTGIYEVNDEQVASYKLAYDENLTLYDNISEYEIILLMARMSYAYKKFLIDCTKIYKDTTFEKHSNLFTILVHLNQIK